MELRPSTLQKKTYSFESYDKAFQKYVSKQTRIPRPSKDVVVRRPIQQVRHVYLTKTKKIIKRPKIKNFKAKDELNNIAKERNWKNHQGGRDLHEQKKRKKIQEMNFRRRVEAKMGQQESLSRNEEEESFFDQIRGQENRRPYFRFKIDDFWILKSQFITKKPTKND